MATAWLDRFIRRVRDAESEEEAMKVTKDYIDPRTGESLDNDGDTHIHLHMNGKGEEGGGDMAAGGMDQDPPPVPGDPAGGSDVAQLAARVAALEEQVQALMEGMSDEEDVELEDPDTQDARRFRLRRRDAMRMRMGDQGAEVPIPERNPEMIGETDLPFIEDLPTGDKGRRFRDHYIKTHDSAEQEDLWGEMVVAAEIIAPGTKIPTFDARLTMQSTGERLCKYRKLVLEKAFKDTATAEIIKDTIGIATFDGVKPLGCDSIKMAFNATAAALRDRNNGAVVRHAAAAATRDQTTRKGPPSLAEMNRNSKSFWEQRKGLHH